MATAERLIESTRALLWERGYAGTSPKAIQQRAGVGVGSMYHHFDGKSGLALAAMERSARELRESAEDHFTGPGTAAERIAGYLLRERDVLSGCPVGRLSMDSEVVAEDRLRAPLDSLFGWLRIRLSELVAEGQRAGELDAGLDPRAVGATIVAVVQGGYVVSRSAESPEPFDAAVRGALQLLGHRRPPPLR
ncbi:TetR/AcrR family transcriptional regulator [Streptomyces tsukubensis]|uniref:TetR family transcriptional regulator n=1 Tax=Streptomyces tsukubensis TaxID=83656 RepID=A0A1V4A495_9ACTN|nr:TetR/AcrR family transcriptional regulator [Streptomyces tsukubensis]OON75397.1 TetR family transcriptional regulator [Streptomyces tsukubensis]QFR94968.1 TetR family transcriptional regulator [Streptomyces tsukubensis]